VEKHQPQRAPEEGACPTVEGARPVSPASYKRPPPASIFITQAIQKTTQTSVFGFQRRSSSSEVRRVEGKRRVEERLVVFV